MESISEIRDNLEDALSEPEIMIMRLGRGESNRNPEDETETHAEQVHRYWNYFNEFSTHIPLKHKALICQYFLHHKRLGFVAEKHHLDRDQARQIIESGLSDVTASIHKLITKIEEC